MLVTKEYTRSREMFILRACPCGYEFDPDEDRGLHFLRDHDPEDFGLSPLGDRNEAAQGPLFERVEDLPAPENSTVSDVAADSTL